MSFSQSLYFGRETDGHAQIDVLISNPSSVDISLLVRSDDSSASSEGILCLHNHIMYCACSVFTGTDNDYSPGPYMLTIPSGDISVSFNLSITDDDILETKEEFLLSIDPSSLPDGVTVGSEGNTTVIIVDNNGKH